MSYHDQGMTDLQDCGGKAQLVVRKRGRFLRCFLEAMMNQ